MALASSALLLRPVQQQPATPSVSSASLVSSASCHGSFSLFLHHRLPQSFRPTISRIIQVQEELPQHAEQQAPLTVSPHFSKKNPPPWQKQAASIDAPRKQNSPPWQRKTSNVESVDTPASMKTHTFRPAPWHQSSRDVPDSHTHDPKQSPSLDGVPTDKASQSKADQSAMARIVEKLRTIQKTHDPVEHVRTEEAQAATGMYPVETNQKAMEILSMSSDLEAIGDVSNLKFPWEKDEKDELELQLRKEKRGRLPSRAELTLSPEELKRLRLLGLQQDERLKIGKLGVTKNIALSIQQQFTTCELVKVRCEGPAAASLKKTELDLEQKTGGLVVLRTGKIIVIYRGSSYNAERRSRANGVEKRVEDLISRENRVNVLAEIPLPDKPDHEVVDDGVRPQFEKGNHNEGGMNADSHPKAVQVGGRMQGLEDYEKEIESILASLGPRYDDWTGLLPVPVDADLLPTVIPNYKPPYRLMPYGIKPRLTNTELTNLRRLARPLAPHFVLGRNRGHQGLAAAMVKLWEKSEIAKVAVKKRVQNTNNLIMAEELKQLTGGILLSRDKFFMTFYRGKDFIPEKVATALVEREALVRDLQEQEEKAREERNIAVKRETAIKPSVEVIGKAAPEAKPSWVHTMDITDQKRMKREVARLQRITLARQMEKKLGFALKKKEKAEQELQKVEAFLKPIDRPTDVETITEEERFMFRKLGLKMKAYLLVGRRGVFDGVVENMHLHWKHRELVKIVVKEPDNEEVQYMARMLEYESGGVLVSVELIKKGQAIIMYRGKNYQRPTEVRPRNLLTKRKALKRSLELQRRASLSKNIKALEDSISAIRVELSKMDEKADNGNKVGSGNEQFETSEALPSLEAEGNVLHEKEGNETIVESKDCANLVSEIEMDPKFFQEKLRKLERLVWSGPIYRADPLTNSERLNLRKEALSNSKAQFFIGKNNDLEGVARGIRIFFLHNALAKIVVKGRTPGTLVRDLVHDLEEMTGGVFVSQETNKIIMYRGWPRGDKIPFIESLEDLSPELRHALEAENVWDEERIEDYMAGEDDSELEEDEYLSDVDAIQLDVDKEDGGDESFRWYDAFEGSGRVSTYDEQDDDDDDDEQEDEDDEEYEQEGNNNDDEDEDDYINVSSYDEQEEDVDNEYEQEDNEDEGKDEEDDNFLDHDDEYEEEDDEDESKDEDDTA